MRSTIHNRQSLPDLAVQECGTFEAAFALAERNGLALTDELAPGQELEYGAEQVVRRSTVVLLAARKARPATAVSADDAARVPWGGVGRMGIETDFIVS